MSANSSEREPVRSAKARYILEGFRQEAGVRIYSFQSTVDGVRTDFTVGVNLALIPTYGIHIQELPLLCRELLERQIEGQEQHSLTLSETEMRVLADTAALARETAAQRRKPRRPPDANTGSAWRAQGPMNSTP